MQNITFVPALSPVVGSLNVEWIVEGQKRADKNRQAAHEAAWNAFWNEGADAPEHRERIEVFASVLPFQPERKGRKNHRKGRK